MARLLTFLAFITALAAGNARAADDYDEIYDYLARRGVVYSQLGPEVNQAMANLLRVAEPNLTVAVNSGAAADIQVIVVNPNAAANQVVAPVKRFEEVLGSVKGNMLSLPGSKILIDKNFVSKLILNAWLDQTQISYGFDEAVKTGGSDLNHLSDVISNRYNPIGDYGRYRFLQRWRTGLIDPTYADDYSRVDLYLQSTLITAALAPVLLHEVGHVRQGTTGNFLDFIDSLIDMIRSPRIRAAEDSADAYAAEKLAAYMATLPKDQYTIAVTGMAATVKLLRDELIEEGFSDLRGLPASDYFSEVYSSDCQESPPYTPPDVLYNRPLVAALEAMYGKDVEKLIAPQAFLFGKITDSEDFPLLTKAELEKLRDKVVSSQSSNHAHRILRAQGISQALKKAWATRSDTDKSKQKEADDVFERFMGAPKALLAALVDNDLSKFTPVVPFKGTHATFGKVSTELPALRFDAAVNCGTPTCRIGTFKDGSPGYVEIHGDASAITMIRAVLPLKFSDTSPAGQRSGAKYVEVLSKLLLESFGETKASDMAGAKGMKSFTILQFFLSHALQCGTFSSRIDDVDPVVSFRAVNPEGWVELLVQGAVPAK